MCELRDGSGFAQEPLAAGHVVGEIGREDLDGDRAVQAPLAGQKHERHPAAPQRRLDVVRVGKGRADLVQRHAGRFCHGHPIPVDPTQVRR